MHTKQEETGAYIQEFWKGGVGLCLPYPPPRANAEAEGAEKNEINCFFAQKN